MQFTPRSAKEIAEAQLWPKAKYPFEVVKAEPAKSGPKSKVPGTPFIKLNVQIWNTSGASRYVNGILHPNMEAQLRNFCEATGLMDKYESGSLSAEDCVGKAGVLKLGIEDDNNGYPPKNVIKDFVVPKANAKINPADVPSVEEDDSIPF